jgi:hypothetical protein
MNPLSCCFRLLPRSVVRTTILRAKTLTRYIITLDCRINKFSKDNNIRITIDHNIILRSVIDCKFVKLDREDGPSKHVIKISVQL